MIDLRHSLAVLISRMPSTSKAGRPRVPLRVMISLLCRKHALNESDEGVVARWGETPTWQYFAAQAYFEHGHPCDVSPLVMFRKLLGEEGVGIACGARLQHPLRLRKATAPGLS